MVQSASTGPHFLGITWSLAVEEQFYLFLPLIIYFVPLRKLPLILIFIIVMTPVARLIFLTQNPVPNPAKVMMLAPCRADTLFLGVLCACLLRHPQGAGLATCRPLLNALMFLPIAFYSVLFGYGGHISSVWSLLGGFFVIALGCAALLLRAVTDRRSLIGIITRWAPLRCLGIIAYGVYLFHQAFNGLLHALLWHREPRLDTAADVLTTLIALGLTLGAATLSWRYFESRFVSLGHKVRYRL